MSRGEAGMCCGGTGELAQDCVAAVQVRWAGMCCGGSRKGPWIVLLRFTEGGEKENPV